MRWGPGLTNQWIQTLLLECYVKLQNFWIRESRFISTGTTLLTAIGVYGLAKKSSKSSNMAESYVADSLSNKTDMAYKILYNKNITEVTVNSADEEVIEVGDLWWLNSSNE